MHHHGSGTAEKAHKRITENCSHLARVSQFDCNFFYLCSETLARNLLSSCRYVVRHHSNSFQRCSYKLHKNFLWKKVPLTLLIEIGCLMPFIFCWNCPNVIKCLDNFSTTADLERVHCSALDLKFLSCISSQSCREWTSRGWYDDWRHYDLWLKELKTTYHSIEFFKRFSLSPHPPSHIQTGKHLKLNYSSKHLTTIKWIHIHTNRSRRG